MAVLPYLSAVVTAAKVHGEEFPPFLCERDAIRKILYCFFFLTITVTPMLAFQATDANISLYIYVYLLLGAVLPTTACIVWPKLAPVFSGRHVNIAEQISCVSRRASAAPRHGPLRFKKALDLFSEGKVFEEMARRAATDGRTGAARCVHSFATVAASIRGEG